MFFFCKPKTIVLDAFTTHRHLVEMFPPDYAIKFRPKWWSEIPYAERTLASGITIQANTMRRCMGFKDYYSDRALIVPLWCSFVMEYKNDGSRYSFAEDKYFIEFQNEIQRGPNYLTGFHQFKLATPWRFREISGVNFLFSQAFYNFKDPTEFIMPPATINYKFQHSLEVNFFVRKPPAGESSRLEIDAGHPMIYLAPLTEKKVIVKTHLVSEEEIKRVNIPAIYFNGLYSRLKKAGYGK